MKKLKTISLLTLSLILLCACSNRNLKKINFKLINTHIISSTKKIDSILVGGLSGIYFDNAQNKLFALSDDKGDIGPARIYVFRLNRDKISEHLTPDYLETIILKDQKGQAIKVGALDPEGITSDGQNLLISTEIYNHPDGGTISAILKFTMDGILTESYLPKKEWMNESDDKTIKVGARQNGGFESVTYDKLTKNLFTASEQSLLQDGNFSNTLDTPPLRIIVTKDFSQDLEYAYLLDKIPNPENLKKVTGDNGLVDLLHFEKRKLIAMERSFVKENLINSVRLYLIDLDQPDASIVNKIPSLKNSSFTPLTKQLLLNLSSILPGDKVGNIEGVSWGPKTKNGNKTLILVSDNNFNPKQTTQFTFIELIY